MKKPAAAIYRPGYTVSAIKRLQNIIYPRSILDVALFYHSIEVLFNTIYIVSDFIHASKAAFALTEIFIMHGVS